MGWSWPTFWYTLLILLLVVAFILVLLWFISLMRKREGMPSHVELYFDENFRKIIDEWDLVSRDKVKEFKKDIGKRLGKVDDDISTLEKKRKNLDKKLNMLEKQIDTLEGS